MLGSAKMSLLNVVMVCIMIHRALTLTPKMLCPDACLCDVDMAGRFYTHCTGGNMQLIPVEHMNHNTEIIVISSPDALHPNMLSIGPIFTQPKPFTKLKEIHIVNSNVPTIGQFSFWGLQNLLLLNLTRNNITSLVSANFRGLINLKYLYLDHNRIKEMPSETFSYLSEVRVLTLTDNQIQALVPRLFRMLAKLYYLDLSMNPLIDLNPDVFKDIQHIRTFKCRRCELKRVNTHVYYLLTNLEELDMGENKFKYLTSDEFISLKQLKILKLDGNQLPVITDNMFANQYALHTLSLSHNRLAMLTPRALNNLTNLRSLDISYNKLNRFNLDTFNPVIEPLRYINFSGNNLQLKEIATVIQKFPEILGIGIANLSIKEIPHNFFADNTHLTELDISWNNLEVFPDELLSQTKFIQRLDISKNKLQGLGEQSLVQLCAILHINITANSWNCEKCDINTMLSYMLSTALNSTIQREICHTPNKLRGVMMGELIDMPMEWCSSNSLQHGIGGGLADESHLSVFAGLVLMLFVVLSAVTAGICFSKHRTADNYTNEEKRRSAAERVIDDQLVYFCKVNDCQYEVPKADANEERLIEKCSVAIIHTAPPCQFIADDS